MTTYNTLFESNHRWRSQSQSLATNNNHMCPKPMHNNRQRPHANICPRCHSPKIKNGCCSHCPRDGASPATGICPNCNSIHRHSCCSFSLEQHWAFLPPSVKDFILNAPSGHLSNDGFISIDRLLEFWSSRAHINLTQRTDICCAAWYLSLVYTRMGMMIEARALCINGAFIHQCILSKDGIDYIKRIASSGESKEYIMSALSLCKRGFYATESPEKIEAYIGTHLPPDYQLSNNITSKDSIADFLGAISDNYSLSSSKNKKHHSSSMTNEKKEGVDMKVVIQDESGSHELDVVSTSTLKVVLEGYAETRGLSIRSLRFSMNGKVVFLSQVGKKTLEALQVQAQDVIVVSDTGAVQDTSINTSKQKDTSSSSSKRSKKKHRRSKPRGNKVAPKMQALPTYATKDERSQEYLKIEHSKRLTKVHDDLEPYLKKIRQRLNNLSIQRNPAKTRHSKPKKTNELSLVDYTSCVPCVSDSKAGKTHFVVHVSGEPSNLYISSKKLSFPPTTTSLDLHGYTRIDAMTKLNETLKVWIELAMKGSYPFVVQTVIICGCGNQHLREVVEEFIKTNKHVSNAPTKRR